MNIYRFLHGVEFQLYTDTSKINHHIEKIRKVKIKYIGTDDKLIHFRWIKGIMATTWKKSPWVEGLAT